MLTSVELAVVARLLHALVSTLCSFGNSDQRNMATPMTLDVSVAELLAGLPYGLLC
jgi:hypothetical protein